MRQLILLLVTISLTACGGTTTIPLDQGVNRIRLGGEWVDAKTTQANLVVCFEDKNYQLISATLNAVVWWNNNLREELGCNPLIMDPYRNGNLYCDVTIRTGETRSWDELAYLDATYSTNRNSYGNFRGEGVITVDENSLRRVEQLGAVLVHELGHVLGLADDPGRPMVRNGSIMEDPVPVNYFLTLNDKRILLENLRCN